MMQVEVHGVECVRLSTACTERATTVTSLVCLPFSMAVCARRFLFRLFLARLSCAPQSVVAMSKQPSLSYAGVPRASDSHVYNVLQDADGTFAPEEPSELMLDPSCSCCCACSREGRLVFCSSVTRTCMRRLATQASA
jgi:hypothetical protein